VDLAELEIFRAVAREQSVTRAAKVLERVQSNVTTRVRQLEESLGVALFQRDSKRMILTPEGHRLLRYAEQMLALAEEARQSMRLDSPSGTLRVGSMESSAATLLPRPLARFHTAWREVELELTTGTTRYLVEAVQGHRLDCVVVAHPGTEAPDDLRMAELGEGLDGVFLRTEELVLVLPANHPKVRRPQDVTLKYLAAFARGCTYRQCAEAWLAQGEEAPGRGVSILEMPSYHAMLACAAAGSAAAVVPRSLLALQRETAELQTVPVRPVHTFLVKRTGFITSAYEAFLQELRHA